MKIYLKNKNLKKNRKEKPIDFLRKLIFNGRYNNFPTTYFDKECTKRQCESGRARSVSDIVDLMRIYYELSEKDAIQIIYELLVSVRKAVMIYCDDIDKLTIHEGTWTKHNRCFFNSFYDYGLLIKNDKTEYIDKYTFEYFYSKVGFTKKEIKRQRALL